MANDKKDLWPDEAFTQLTVLPPLQILREQGNSLTERTRGVLRGDVTTSTTDNKFTHHLAVEAPSLDYRIVVVRVTHSATKLYPADVLVVGTGQPGMIGRALSERDLRSALAKALRTDRVKGIVSALLAQIHAQ